MPRAMTLSRASFARASAMSAINVEAGSLLRSFAIWPTSLPTYDGSSSQAPITRSSGAATCERMKSVSARSSKLRFGYNTVSVDCHIVHGYTSAVTSMPAFRALSSFAISRSPCPHSARIASFMCDTCTGIRASRPIASSSSSACQNSRSSLRMWLM